MGLVRNSTPQTFFPTPLEVRRAAAISPSGTAYADGQQSYIPTPPGESTIAVQCRIHR